MKKTYSTKELAQLLQIAQQNVHGRAKRENWKSEPRKSQGGGYTWLFDSMPEKTQYAIRKAELQNAPVGCNEPTNSIQQPKILSASKKEHALVKSDLLRLYVEFQEAHGKRVRSKEKFIEHYNNGAYPEIFAQLGEVSWKTLERWKNKQNKSQDYLSLADKRGMAHCGKSIITEAHKAIILGQVLNPNAPFIGQVARKVESRCKEEGLTVPSDATIRRFINTYISESYDEYVLFREGKKAWNDKCCISILRDWSLVQVGDVIIADGHTLNFETINPETGKPKRMTLLLFFDGASNHPLGWEVMATENVQCISAAFRRSCMLLGKFPKVVYLDNGRAFRAKYFEGCRDFQQAGIDGLYESLGVKVIHAWAYHGQSKPIERFFGTMHDMEISMPSYVGRNISEKPARLHRNEKLHQKLHEKLGGRPLTLEETHTEIAKWFAQYVQRRQPRTHLKNKCPAEVFEQGRGEGLTQGDLARLDVLMMQKTVRTITKDGFRLHGKLYWHEVLASRRHEILIRYDEILSPNCVKVYTKDGEFLCEARNREYYGIAHGIHPAAQILGTEEQKAQLQYALELKKNQEKMQLKTLKSMVSDVILPEMEIRNKAIEINQEVKAIPLPESEKPMTKAEIAEFDAKVKELEDKIREYTPSSMKRFKDSLARYAYLFEMKFEKNIKLTIEDEAWFEKFEETSEYQKFYKNRYDTMKEYLKNIA